MRKQEFSKIIVVWAMIFTTFFTAVLTFGYFWKGHISGELVGLVGTVITGVIVSYAAKSGVENYQKIRGAWKKDESD